MILFVFINLYLCIYMGVCFSNNSNKINPDITIQTNDEIYIPINEENIHVENIHEENIHEENIHEENIHEENIHEENIHVENINVYINEYINHIHDMKPLTDTMITNIEAMSTKNKMQIILTYNIITEYLCNSVINLVD